MKKIILSIVFISCSFLLQAQDIITPPRLFNKYNDTIVEPVANSFLLGWNWGCYGKNLDEALLLNAIH
jgi:hypothetical protein